MADQPLTLSTTMGFFYNQRLPMLRAFIALFFPNIVTTSQSQVQVDRYTKNFKNIGYVPLHGASRLSSFGNGKGILYKPPRISEKTPIGDDYDAVTVGVDATAPITEHLAKKYALIQETHADNIWTVLCLQAIEMMRTGAFTAKTAVDGQAVGVFDYDRDSTLGFNYDTSVNGAYNGLKELFGRLNKFHIPKGGLVAIVGSNYMSALEDDTDFQDAQKNTQYQIFANNQAGEPFGGAGVVMTICRVKIPGSAYYVTLVSFDESYDENGTQTAFVPLNEVIMTTTQNRNTAIFGGVKVADHASRELRIVEGEIVTDRKLFDEPDDLCLRSQSRGLLIPANINHIGRLTATDLDAS